jgi:uncharacterized delta-60 repeat protein
MNQEIARLWITLRQTPLLHQLAGISCCLLLLGILLLNSPALLAAPGDLDPDFGEGGTVTTGIAFGNWPTYDSVGAVLVQPDGKILVAGGKDEYTSSWAYFVIARYQADGSPDASFGNGGRAFLFKDICNVVQDIALQSDGKIIAVGTSGCQGFQQSSTIFRLNANGKVDTSFGENGQSSLATDGIALATTVEIMADDKIVVGGTNSYNGNQPSTLLLARYTSSGFLDPTFDGDGILTPPVGEQNAGIAALAVQTDQRIVVVGNTFTNAGSDWLMARYQANGVLDTTFGNSGMVTTTPLANGGASAVLIQPDGKIVVGGTTNSGTDSDAALLRYTASGLLDNAFDEDGVVILDNDGNDRGVDVGLQSNGQILLAGQSTLNQFSIWRFTADGTLDPSFGANGNASTAVADNANAYLVDMVLQSDGQPILVGDVLNDFAIIRFSANGALDSAFGSEGKILMDVGEPIIGSFGAAKVASQANGRFAVTGSVFNENTYHQDLVVVRYLADGSFDPTMGYTITSVDNNADHLASELLFFPDGRLLVVGNIINSENDTRNILLLRYAQDGALDPTFDSDGILITDLGATIDQSATAATLQDDGKIVVAGSVGGEDPISQLLVLRYNPDGSLDSTFGNSGAAIIDLAPALYLYSRAYHVVVQANGKLTVLATLSGYDETSDSDVNKFAVVQLTAAGALDTTFSGDGIVTTDLPSNIGIADTAIQPDGKIVIAGSAREDQYEPGDFALMRFNTDGSVDTTFGANGIVVQDMGNTRNDDISALALQADGRIIASGSVDVDSFGYSQFLTARFTTDGALDASFGNNGQIRTNFDVYDYAYSGASDLLIQNDGKILAAGSTAGEYPDPAHIALARYLGDQLPTITIVLDNAHDLPTNFGFGGNLGRLILDDPATNDGDEYSHMQTFEVTPGTYTIRRNNTSAWIVTDIVCTPNAATIQLDPPSARITVNDGDNVTCTFTLKRKGWITARAFNDLVRNNANLGRRNAADPWLENWTFTVYTDPETVVASGETQPLGANNVPQIRFNYLAAGAYTVCVDLPDGSWLPTSPGTIDPIYGKPCKTVTVDYNQGATLNFGAYQPEIQARSGFTPADEVVTDEDVIINLPYDPTEDETVDGGETAGQLFIPFVSR